MPPRTPVTVDEDLNVEYVALAQLRRWPGNPKEHDLGAIAGSMIRFGFRDPIGVNRRDNFIEEGHGRLDTLSALKDQQREPPRFIRIGGDGEWYVPVLHFDDDEITARGYGLAHNRTQELGGGYDSDLLLLALEEQARYGLLPGTGFDSDDLHALQQRLAQGAEDQSSQLHTSFQVLVTCGSEQQQLELLERLQGEGLTVRALNA